MILVDRLCEELLLFCIHKIIGGFLVRCQVVSPLIINVINVNELSASNSFSVCIFLQISKSQCMLTQTESRPIMEDAYAEFLKSHSPMDDGKACTVCWLISTWQLHDLRLPPLFSTRRCNLRWTFETWWWQMPRIHTPTSQCYGCTYLWMPPGIS